MDRSRNLPDADRLSILSALILLAYALARFIDLPSRTVELQLPGLYLAWELNVRTAAGLLVAAMTAAGVEWLLRQHPAAGKHGITGHWLLPALTAWVIGAPLFQLPLGLTWWAGFALGGSLLMLVLVAEYIAIDPDDVRQPAAAAGLTALAYALFLILATSLSAAGARLIFTVPALTLAAFLTSLRTLRLRLHLRWALLESGLVALLVTQFAAALYYLPLSPVSYGLLLLGPAYGLTTLLANLAEGDPWQQAAIEPLLVFVIVISISLWIR